MKRLFERIVWWLLPKSFKRWVFDMRHDEINRDVIEQWALMFGLEGRVSKDDIIRAMRGEK